MRSVEKLIQENRQDSLFSLIFHLIFIQENFPLEFIFWKSTRIFRINVWGLGNWFKKYINKQAHINLKILFFRDSNPRHLKTYNFLTFKLLNFL
jgi:hypothetical protein